MMCNGSPRYALTRPVRAPCSALTPAGRCGAHIGPEFTQLFLVSPHTPPHFSSPDLCFARVRLLFPVGWRLVWRAGSCSSNWSMGNYATLVPVVITSWKTSSAIFLVPLMYWLNWIILAGHLASYTILIERGVIKCQAINHVSSMVIWLFVLTSPDCRHCCVSKHFEGCLVCVFDMSCWLYRVKTLRPKNKIFWLGVIVLCCGTFAQKGSWTEKSKLPWSFDIEVIVL